MEEQKNELTVEATLDNLDRVIEFVEDTLGMTSCPMKVCMQFALCVEELFVNVASYAYEGKTGDCTVSMKTQHTDTDGTAVFTIVDSGQPFDPLAKEDPDITLSADERQIGGLGIFMVKKSMDNVEYSYENKKNILTLVKSWHT
ncbi:MAG: ATP-binding protein [Wujia sp.]